MSELKLARIFVSDEGSIIFVYDDELYRDLKHNGITGVPVRASSVDATEDGMWWADLSRVGGPRLGPFDSHGLAVEGELKWLGDALPSVDARYNA